MKYADLHQFQMIILRKMMPLPLARFRDLKIQGLSTDHVSYHLQALINQDLIYKADNNYYALTDKGKDYVSMIGDHTATIEVQGKIGALIRVSKREGKKTFYLVNKRLKQPFFNYVGFHTGKIKAGESVQAAAARELCEETGLTAELHFVAVFHYLDYKENGDFLRDMYFYVFNGFNVKGNLIGHNPNEGVENFWTTLTDLKKEKTFPGFWEQPMYLGKKKKTDDKAVFFKELVRVVSEY